MMRWLLMILIALGAQAVSASGPRSAPLPALPPVSDCARLVRADLGQAVGAAVSITSARLYAGAEPFCGVQGRIAPRIGFAVRLPTAGWTQRYLQLGCGGLCGTVAIRPDHDAGCGPVTSGQTVLASTDMGHGGGMMAPANWGDDPQLRRDFAYRGVHLTALAAKALIRRFYGRPPRFSYFAGCSDGGREALMEAQRFPQDFNGIAAGAPAMNFLVQNSFYHAWQARSNTGSDGRPILLAAKLPELHRAALASCDAADGLADGQITDPRLCRFDPVVAQCGPGETPTQACLTPAEVSAARKLYDGPRDATGHRFTIGGPQVGSELSWAGVFVPATPDGPTISPKAALDVIKHLAFPQNPPETTTLADFRFDQATFARLVALHPLYDSTNTDLDAFARAGGKLILYHGWSDPHISPLNTIAYYKGLEERIGTARVRAFARLFLFPGMYHCGGGDGPAEFDILTPLMDWVEAGTTPDMILAARAQGAGVPMGPPPVSSGDRSDHPTELSPPVAVAVDPFGDRLVDRQAATSTTRTDRTRPIFAYPQAARYLGRGSTEDARNFAAGPPLVRPGSTPDWVGKNFIGPFAPLR